MNILLTVEELAKYLKIKPDTIYKKVRKGELPAVKLGKLVRFPKEAIDQWLVGQATKTVKEVKATMRDVKAARKVVEGRVEEAVTEVRKRAKVASKIINEVPEVLEDVRKAPLNKKQQILAKGLKTLWKDLSNGVTGSITTSPRARAKKASSRKISKKTKIRATAVRVSAAPVDEIAGTA